MENKKGNLKDRLKNLIINELTDKLKEYLKTFQHENVSQINFSVQDSQIDLAELQIREDLLIKLGIPFVVVNGTINKLSVKIPFLFKKKHACISVDTVQLKIRPVSLNKGDKDYSSGSSSTQRKADYKNLRLRDWEGKFKRYFDKLGSDGKVSKSFSIIMNNMIINIKNIQLILEGNLSLTKYADDIYHLKIRIEEFSLMPINEKNEKTFNTDLSKTYKLFVIDGFSVSINYKKRSGSFIKTGVFRDLLMKTQSNLFKKMMDESFYVVHPFSFNIFIRINENPDLDYTIEPKKNFFFQFNEPILTSFNHKQLSALLATIQEVKYLMRLKKFLHLRPNCIIRGEAQVKAWWQYAISVVIEEQKSVYTFEKTAKKIIIMKLYIELYKRSQDIINVPWLYKPSSDEKKLLLYYEQKLSCEDIIKYREIALIEIRIEAKRYFSSNKGVIGSKSLMDIWAHYVSNEYLLFKNDSKNKNLPVNLDTSEKSRLYDALVENREEVIDAVLKGEKHKSNDISLNISVYLCNFVLLITSDKDKENKFPESNMYCKCSECEKERNNEDNIAEGFLQRRAFSNSSRITHALKSFTNLNSPNTGVQSQKNMIKKNPSFLIEPGNKNSDNVRDSYVSLEKSNFYKKAILKEPILEKKRSNLTNELEKERGLPKFSVRISEIEKEANQINLQGQDLLGNIDQQAENEDKEDISFFSKSEFESFGEDLNDIAENVQSSNNANQHQETKTQSPRQKNKAASVFANNEETYILLITEMAQINLNLNILRNETISTDPNKESYVGFVEVYDIQEIAESKKKCKNDSFCKPNIQHLFSSSSSLLMNNFILILLTKFEYYTSGNNTIKEKIFLNYLRDSGHTQFYTIIKDIEKVNGFEENDKPIDVSEFWKKYPPKDSQILNCFHFSNKFLTKLRNAKDDQNLFTQFRDKIMGYLYQYVYPYFIRDMGVQYLNPFFDSLCRAKRFEPLINNKLDGIKLPKSYHRLPTSIIRQHINNKLSASNIQEVGSSEKRYAIQFTFNSTVISQPSGDTTHMGEKKLSKKLNQKIDSFVDSIILNFNDSEEMTKKSTIMKVDCLKIEIKVSENNLTKLIHVLSLTQIPPTKTTSSQIIPSIEHIRDSFFRTLKGCLTKLPIESEWNKSAANKKCFEIEININEIALNVFFRSPNENSVPSFKLCFEEIKIKSCPLQHLEKKKKNSSQTDRYFNYFQFSVKEFKLLEIATNESMIIHGSLFLSKKTCLFQPQPLLPDSALVIILPFLKVALDSNLIYIFRIMKIFKSIREFAEVRSEKNKNYNLYQQFNNYNSTELEKLLKIISKDHNDPLKTTCRHCILKHKKTLTQLIFFIGKPVANGLSSENALEFQRLVDKIGYMDTIGLDIDIQVENIHQENKQEIKKTTSGKILNNCLCLIVDVGLFRNYITFMCGQFKNESLEKKKND